MNMQMFILSFCVIVFDEGNIINYIDIMTLLAKHIPEWYLTTESKIGTG